MPGSFRSGSTVPEAVIALAVGVAIAGTLIALALFG